MLLECIGGLSLFLSYFLTSSLTIDLLFLTSCLADLDLPIPFDFDRDLDESFLFCFSSLKHSWIRLIGRCSNLLCDYLWRSRLLRRAEFTAFYFGKYRYLRFTDGLILVLFCVCEGVSGRRVGGWFFSPRMGVVLCARRCFCAIFRVLALFKLNDNYSINII